MDRPTLFLALACLFLAGCATSPQSENAAIFARENLLAWCIVPFDAAGRNAEQRAAMLKELNLRHYAYDWRAEHLPFLEEEIRTMRKHNIDIAAVWIWINDGEGELLDEQNRLVLNTIKGQNLQTDLWTGFNEHIFDSIPEPERLPLAVKMVGELRTEAAQAGCTLSLYNHLGWMGEPQNMVRIIETLGARDVGIVYNFHHAHEQIDAWERNLALMLPYLRTVNLNGMRPEGPKILPIGQGTKELEMLRILKKSGYQGTVGIIGHTDGLDIKPVLEQNIAGLEALAKKL